MRYLVMENTPLARQVYRLMLMGDTSGIRAPGQFVQVQVPGFYLRRPISVCDWDAQTLTLIVKEVGEGTHAMAAWEIGAQVDLLTGLGNGYTIMQQSQTPLLVGGGVGVPPLYGLARRLVEAGRTPRVALGFQTADDAFYLAEFA
ncbi:MAG: dihydroorotate dehydrogenase electron transfer subunit, partial [Clostridia bacterium]